MPQILNNLGGKQNNATLEKLRMKASGSSDSKFYFVCNKLCLLNDRNKKMYKVYMVSTSTQFSPRIYEVNLIIDLIFTGNSDDDGDVLVTDFVYGS